jgi:AmmeMemoRadiSam system protein A
MVDGPIVFAGLMPHAPILVPGVGRERLAEANATAGAMVTVAEHAVASRPDTVVLISPHSPRQPGAFGIWQTPRLRGSLASFGSPEDRVDLPLDQTFVERLIREAERRRLKTWGIVRNPLDHGALVPLCYLVAARWNGPTVILSLNYPGEGGLEELGQAIVATAQALHRRIAIIASGDMSHRLTQSAPGGYHPDAHRFDEAFIARLRDGVFNRLQRIDPTLQEEAGEDVLDSTVVAVAAANYRTDGHKVLSYEGPFGVGYGVAILFEPATGATAGAAAREVAPPVVSRYEDLPAVARRAVQEALAHGLEAPPFQAAGILAERRAVFVTLRTAKGELRGCRGRLAPKDNDLVRETWETAAAAAFHDYRFPPLTAAELPDVTFSVTVLGELEPVVSHENLDPALYGVVVAAVDGRKGVLLPGIAGIDSVKQQLAIARQKAGIDPEEWVKLQRFRAKSYQESPAGAAEAEHDG